MRVCSDASEANSVEFIGIHWSSIEFGGRWLGVERHHGGVHRTPDLQAP